MNYTTIFTSILTVTLTIATPVLAQTLTPTLEATDSAQPDFDTIKENVKKRLQEVVQDRVLSDFTKEKVAIFGTLKSRAGNTLSIETGTSVKLASTSSQTQVVRLPASGSFTLDDVSLEDYVVALGYLDDADVLDTRKLIVHKAAPVPPQYQVAFGKLSSYSTKDFTLTLENVTDTTTSTYLVSRKAKIREALLDDTYKDLPRNKALPENSYVLVIYVPSADPADENVAYHLLIRSNPSPASTSEIPSPTP